MYHELASVRVCARVRVAASSSRVTAPARALSFSSDTMCARQEYTLLIAGGCEKEAGNTRNRSHRPCPASANSFPTNPLRVLHVRRRECDVIPAGRSTRYYRIYLIHADDSSNGNGKYFARFNHPPFRRARSRCLVERG